MQARQVLATLAAILIAAAALMLGQPALAAPAQPPQPDSDGWPGDDVHLAIQPCTIRLPFGELDGETIVCGTLSVPVDYAQPEGKHLEIAFAQLLSRSLSPAAEPVVYLQGGPGGSSLQRLSEFAELFATLRTTHDVILFDQRGALFSNPLSCQPVLQSIELLAETDAELAGIYAEIEAADGGAAVPAAALSWVYGTCATLYAEQGYDLAQFNSRNNARDLMNLVHGLGYDAANLYGISYGTRLALVAMRDWPAHIRSVVLDSSYPPQINAYEQATTLHEEQLQNIFAACAQDAACATAYPDLAERLHTLLQADLQLTNAGGDELSFVAYLARLPGMINRQPVLANWLPRIIAAAEKGDIVDLEQLSAIAAQPEESLPFSREDELLLTVQEVLDELQQQGEELAQIAYAETPGVQFMRQLLDAAGLLSPEEQAGLLVEMALTLSLSSDPPRTALADLLAATFDAQAAAPLLEALDQLAAADLRTVMDIVRVGSSNDDVLDGMFTSFECNEEVPFNDMASAEAALEKQAFPELGLDGLEVNAQSMLKCAVWPQSTVRPAFRQPVTSEIPTLVFSGLLDTQTPPSWNTEAASSLSNVYLMEFPMAGHAVLIFSQCAKDISQAFVNSPHVRPNDRCIAQLQPAFVPPDAELPLLPD